MKVGTKSVLVGAHQFLLHPLFVAYSWYRLYGFPWDPRLWLAFFVHDIGYIGKPNMDGLEGEEHVLLGAKIMGVFGKKWRDLSLYHSRFYAKRDNAEPSKLCYADKLAFTFTPAIIYVPMATWSTEIFEYMSPELREDGGKYEEVNRDTENPWCWCMTAQEYLCRWVYENYQKPQGQEVEEPREEVCA